MTAYKFLRGDGSGFFSRFQWPLPSNGNAGAWVEAAVDPCVSGVHACRPQDLPYWVGRTLWRVELDEPVIEERSKIVAARGRLLERIAEWDDDLRAEYTEMCAARARELALAASPPLDEWAAVATLSIPEGPALLGFVAARIAEEVEGIEAYHREREQQARWLVERLGLDA